MNEYEQMEMDLRLQPERDLDENIGILLSFAHRQLIDECKEIVKNRYEGYGILTERFALINGAMKDVKKGMDTLMGTLSGNDSAAADAVAFIDNSLSALVKTTVQMSAEARRTADDLYMASANTKTPLEEYMEEQDGFEETPEDGEASEDEEVSDDEV